MERLYEEIIGLLKTDERFFSKDGELLKNNVFQAAMNMDKELIQLLMSNEAVKNRFFKKVSRSWVFNQVEFGWLINNHEFFPDSYTRFKNKIGLVDEQGNSISNSNKVELVFPYKDCVLEAGMTKEDNKCTEVFYNETLAPNEVDRLMEPKVLSNAKLFNKDGENDAQKIQDDNIVINGNNLLSIASLLPRFEGQIKLIYIDPPYNTKTDKFPYNDNFNRSTWLTFMKNRLEIAKRLLSEDGAIYVQLDYHQVHYAKVLMDEIFEEENFQREIIWRIGWLSGYKTKDNNWIRNHDTILFYSKNHKELKFNKNVIPNEEYRDLVKSKDISKCLKEYKVPKKEIKKICHYINHDAKPEKTYIDDVWNGNEYDDLNSIAIVSFAGETVSKLLEEDDEVKGQKPEKLIERIIRAHTDEGDYVLDFFGGTGTTAAAAMKTNRKFIICEQLDKHIDIIIRRLKEVIKGDNVGISKRNNWKGGGSFIYFELAKLNQYYFEKIKKAKTKKELNNLYNKIIKSGFISRKVSVSEIDTNKKQFDELSFANTKKFLIELLDKNLLYVNYCDIDDQEFNISDEDKKFSNSFYGEE